MRSAYPQVLLHLSDGYNSLLRERLLHGRLDIALLFADQPERGLAIEPLLLEELFYVTADRDNSPVRIADAAQRPLLICGPNSVNRRIAQEAFKKYGLTVAPVAEIDTLSTLRRAITSGLGNADPVSVRALRRRGRKSAQLPALCRRENGPACSAVLF